ncbi:hypothetical protein Tco_0089667 [Tanacetum coccineum]
MKRVNTFVDYRIKLVEESSKKAESELEENLKKAEAKVMKGSSERAGEELEQESIKKQKATSLQLLEDLEDLYKLVKAKYGSTRQVEDLDLIYNGKFLKKMFEPHVEDQVWKNKDDYNVLDWNLYDSCGVHSLRMQHVYIHVLVEKRYPLTPSIITYMLNKKLHVAVLKMKWHIQLLKLLTK